MSDRDANYLGRSVFVPRKIEADDMGSEESDSSSGNETTMGMDTTAACRSISDDDDELEEKKRKFVEYAKRILPHVCLVILLFVYLLIGATIFRAIEGPNELIQRENELSTIIRLRNEFREHMRNVTQNNKISEGAFNRINEEYFDRLARAMIFSIRNQYVNEKHLLNETGGDELLWTFPNSIFFATTVITTIGYGNLVPATTLGRVACIIFALFGIPLQLVTITDIGKFMSEFFCFLNRSYLALKREIRLHFTATRVFAKTGSINQNDDGSTMEEREVRIPIFMVLLALLVYTAVGGFLFKSFEGLQYFDAFYACFMTIGTVAFGVNVPTEQMYTFFTIIYIIFGLSLARMCIDLAETKYIQQIYYLSKKMRSAFGTMKSRSRVSTRVLKHANMQMVTATGKIVQVRLPILNREEIREVMKTGKVMIETASGKLVKPRGVAINRKEADEEATGVDEALVGSSLLHQRNILLQPISQAALNLVKENDVNNSNNIDGSLGRLTEAADIIRRA